MPRANRPPGRPVRTLDSIGLDQWRQYLGSNIPESTSITTFLDSLENGQDTTAQSDEQWQRYQRYLAIRDERRRHAVDQAGEQADRSYKPSPDELGVVGGETPRRHHQRQQARQHAHNTFEATEPLLGWLDWLRHDEPETYRPNVVERAVTRAKEMIP